MGIRKSEIVTGFFALTVIAIAIFLALKSGDLEAGDFETCSAIFDDVNLLEQGAKVAVAGKEVGSVKSIEEVLVEGPDGIMIQKIEVVFTVKQSVFDRLQANTRAQVGQESLLGAKFVKIKGSTQGGDFERRDDRPLIETSPLFDMFAALESFSSKLDPIMTELQKTVESVNNELLPRLNKLIDDNGGKLSTLLDNSNDLVLESKGTVTELRERMTGEGGFMDNADKLAKDMDELVLDLRSSLKEIKDGGLGTLENVDKLIANADASLLKLTRRLDEETLPHLDRTMTQAEELMKSAQGNLNTLTGATTTTLGNIDNVTTDPNLFATMVEARDALREVKLLMLSLRANPAQIIFGGPGEVDEATSKSFDERKQHASGRGKRYDP